MAYSRRAYRGAAVPNLLGGGTLLAGSYSITLQAPMSGWSTSGTPFFAVIEPGTPREEKVCVIYSTDTTLTVVNPAATSGWTGSALGRGVDNTVAQDHNAGSAIYPVFTATEANQANELVSKYTANGDIVVHGETGFKTIGISGTSNNNKVLVADSTVTDGGVKWASVDTANITNSAVTADKIADNAVTQAKMADNSVGAPEIINASVGLDELTTAVVARLVPVGTIAMYGGASAPTGWLLCNGDAIDAGYTALKAIVGNNTPDFKGRFALGDNSTLTLLGVGGSATISEGNLPSHAHANSATASTTVTINNGGGHGHTASSGDAGAHSHTISTEAGEGAHQHKIPTNQVASGTHGHTTNGTISSGLSGTGGTSAGFTSTLEANYEGKHTHTGTAAAVGNHSHTVTVDAVAAHAHTNSATTTVTMSNAFTGSGTAYYQPYLVVNYIIKHD